MRSVSVLDAIGERLVPHEVEEDSDLPLLISLGKHAGISMAKMEEEDGAVSQ